MSTIGDLMFMSSKLSRCFLLGKLCIGGDTKSDREEKHHFDEYVEIFSHNFTYFLLSNPLLQLSFSPLVFLPKSAFPSYCLSSLNRIFLRSIHIYFFTSPKTNKKRRSKKPNRLIELLKIPKNILTFTSIRSSSFPF